MNMTVREYWENYNDSGDAFIRLSKYDYVEIAIYPEYDDEYDTFVVCGNESWGEEYYVAEYPIEDIVREFEEKWGIEVKEYLENLKHIQDTEDYLSNMYRDNVDFYKYQMIITEGVDYGIKFKECYCPYKGYYIEF